MGGACGTYGGEEGCLKKFERKNSRSVFVAMSNLAMILPVVLVCMYHKDLILSVETTCAICLRLYAAYIVHVKAGKCKTYTDLYP
jgi:hypothetical protein